MLKKYTARAALAALLSVSAGAQAAWVPGELEGAGVPHVERLETGRFLEQAAGAVRVAAASSTPDEQPTVNVGGRVIALRGHSDLALWNLVAVIHSQQKNNAFDLMDASQETVRALEADQVSAVPLPGILWLFVMGLLGIAGSRVAPSQGADSKRDALSVA